MNTVEYPLDSECRGEAVVCEDAGRALRPGEVPIVGLFFAASTLSLKGVVRASLRLWVLSFVFRDSA